VRKGHWQSADEKQAACFARQEQIHGPLSRTGASFSLKPKGSM